MTRQDPKSYYLYDAKGQGTVTLPSHATFDMSKPAMRKLFVSDCAYAVDSGVFDGCFIDRAK